MRRHPLARALRIDKLSLAALAATLESYADPARAKREIPALRMLCAPPETLRARAEELCGMIARLGADCACEVVPTERPVGGGCAPGQLLKGSAVAVTARAFGADALAARLRAAPVPVVARISEGRQMCIRDRGYIGYDLQNALREELLDRGIHKPVSTLITQVVVDPEDPAFKKPTKPIGSFMTEEAAKKLAAEKGYTVMEDAGRGWRRVVASPRPQHIVEIETIRTLVNAGQVVVARCV